LKKLLILSLLALGYQSASAQLVTESFGAGANAFTMDFVTIGNPGNEADTTGLGSVNYVYNIGKYEISRGMIEKANLDGDLGLTLMDMTNLASNGVNKPAIGINWNEAARFVNYLNTSNGYHAAYNFTTSRGDGDITLWGSAEYSGSNQYRHKDAYYFLPSVDEWYKAAYGSASKLVLGGFSWNSYPTGNGDVPLAVSGGTSDGTAVYDGQAGPADITNAGGLSAYGTMGQGGNVWEWIETASDAVNNTPDEARLQLGGSWAYLGTEQLSNLNKTQVEPWVDWGISDGFRIASIPEPSSLSLLALGGVVVALRRRR